MASGPTALPSHVVIDLTLSDSEDLPVHAAVPPLAAIATRPHALPSSNHGLTPHDGPSLGATQESRKDNGLGNSSSPGRRASLRGVESPGTKRFPPSTHGGVLRPPNGNSQVHTWLYEHNPQEVDDGVPVANTAKRRRTHGGFTAAPISRDLNGERPTAQDTQANAGQAPASGEASASGHSSSASVVEIPAPGPAQIGRRETPHAQPPSYRLSDEPDRNSEEKALAALDSQIFRHVRFALQEYRKTIPKAQRHRIFSKVIQKLLDEPDLLDDFEENHWTLPANYEEKLAVKAKQYVDALASRVRSNSGALQSSESASGDSPGPPDAWPRGESFLAVDRTGTAQQLDLSSTSSPQALQAQGFLPRMTRQEDGLQPTLDDSYSPYSNGFNQASERDTQLHVSKRTRRKRQKNSPEVRRSSRLVGNASPPKEVLKRSIQARRDADDNNKTSPEPKKYKPTAASIRKAHALRISALESTARPYSRFTDLDDIRRGCDAIKGSAGRYISEEEREILDGTVLHVDFCHEEIELLYRIVAGANFLGTTDLKSQFITIMASRINDIDGICMNVKKAASVGSKSRGWQLLRSRTAADIRAFLEDAASGHITDKRRIICIDFKARSNIPVQKPPTSSLLRERANWGMAPFRVGQGHSSFNIEITNHVEDSFVRRSEWTDCCGDIATVSWTGNQNFVCGATAHSDYHNMQYNKPGNLLVGSTSLDTLRAVDGHRIQRPVIDRAENAENALDSMRQTQDPWLYTSVVSTSYSEVSKCMFTASFDQTVKIWKVAHDGSSMSPCGEWKHDGKVNFVVTSENHNKVATASDVSSNAIRVYKFNEQDIPGTPYDTYSGDKAQEQAAELERKDTWTYFPATIQWGKAESVASLLIVGYSPRSSTGHEVDIPDEKKNSGELCIWDVENGQRVQISSARTQNVFEVIWHPTRPMFLAATSPAGIFEPEVKTQIRLFTLSKFGTFLHIKTLDCPALDINELTIQPNSLQESYVSASCTDGNTYIWDTAQGDGAIHVLGHGTSLDNPLHDLPLEIADSGVKFASWGQSIGRFYTGSSDGKVKAWDVRAPTGEAFVRTVLSLSGGISAGAFSKDFSKLLIGDATGKVHLIHADDSCDYDHDDGPTNENPTSTEQKATGLPADNTAGNDPHLHVKKPKVIIPHPEPLPPGGLRGGVDERETAQALARDFLSSGQLTLHRDPGIGVIQGPNYSDVLLYRYEAHEDDDGTKPLRPEWGTRQQYHLHSQASQIRLPRLPNVQSSNAGLHNANRALDFDVSSLRSEVTLHYSGLGIDLKFEEDHRFDLEMTPGDGIFDARRLGYPAARPTPS